MMINKFKKLELMFKLDNITNIPLEIQLFRLKKEVKHK